MESSTDYRPAVDVGPKTRTGLVAFVLALLSVPGSTLAWDLPAGGFWIGMPLAAIAIYLGFKARRTGNSPGLATTAIVIAGLMVAMTVAWTVASLFS